VKIESFQRACCSSKHMLSRRRFGYLLIRNPVTRIFVVATNHVYKNHSQEPLLQGTSFVRKGHRNSGIPTSNTPIHSPVQQQGISPCFVNIKSACYQAYCPVYQMREKAWRAMFTRRPSVPTVSTR
jgi:hypothetical protein